MKKLISVALAAMMALTAFSGCSKKPASSSQASEGKAALTFVWWGNQTRNDRTQKLISQYESQNPNVTITAQFTDWNSYWNKLATQEAANSTPDIIQMDYTYIDQYVGKKLLLDMTPYTKNGTLDVSFHVESQSGKRSEKNRKNPENGVDKPFYRASRCNNGENFGFFVKRKNAGFRPNM